MTENLIHLDLIYLFLRQRRTNLAQGVECPAKARHRGGFATMKAAKMQENFEPQKHLTF